MFDFAAGAGNAAGAKRQGAAVLVSAVIHAGLIVAATALAVAQAQPEMEAPVEVTFVKAHAAPPPPTSPPARKPRTRPKAPEKIVAPVVLPETPPNPVPEPEEPPPEEEPEDEGGEEAGVEGGVAGGGEGGGVGDVLGGTPGGTLEEEIPVYAGVGFTKPHMERPNCLAETIRVPQDLHGLVRLVVVKFAVSTCGQISQVTFVTAVPDRRIENAITAALTGCAWVAGTDTRGKPVSQWVTLPIRFATG